MEIIIPVVSRVMYWPAKFRGFSAVRSGACRRRYSFRLHTEKEKAQTWGGLFSYNIITWPGWFPARLIERSCAYGLTST